MQIMIFEAVLLIFMICCAIAIILCKDILAAIVVSGVFSFCAVLTYFMMGSPDVAFTEAVIGTMLTIFLVAAIRKVDRWCKK